VLFFEKGKKKNRASRLSLGETAEGGTALTTAFLMIFAN
jgi:hypothetical protein